MVVECNKSTAHNYRYSFFSLEFLLQLQVSGSGYQTLRQKVPGNGRRMDRQLLSRNGIRVNLTAYMGQAKKTVWRSSVVFMHTNGMMLLVSLTGFRSVNEGMMFNL